MKSFFSQLDLGLISHSSDPSRVAFLVEVKEFIKLGVCLSYKHKMKYLPYWGSSSAEVSRVLGVSAATVRSATSKMSAELWDQFGHDFFNRMADNPQLVRDRFNVVQNYRGMDDLFMFGFRQLLPKPVDGLDIKIRNCKKEIEFLKKHAKKSVEEEIKSLNHENLSYVLDLLDGEPGCDLRVKLINFFLK